MKKFLIVGFMLLSISLLLSSCATVPEEEQCLVDSDCVAATCCHATEGVNSAFAPSCEGQLCTANCEPGTLDCGYNVLECVKGGCKLVEVEE